MAALLKKEEREGRAAFLLLGGRRGPCFDFAFGGGLRASAHGQGLCGLHLYIVYACMRLFIMPMGHGPMHTIVSTHILL